MTLNDVAEESTVKYWRQRALQAEEIAREALKTVDLDQKEIARLIAHHTTDNMRLYSRALSQLTSAASMVLNTMTQSDKLPDDAVNVLRGMAVNIDKVLALYDGYANEQ